MAALTAAGVDCVGPAGDPEPGTPAWEQRELENRICARQGAVEWRTNPAYHAALAESYPGNRDLAPREYPLGPRDPFRAPHRWDDVRGQYDVTSFVNSEGDSQRLMVFRPLPACGPASSGDGCPDGVPRHDNAGPLPGVLILDYVGNSQPVLGAAHFQHAQTLAEHGYMVGIGSWPVTSDTAPDAVDYFLSTPDEPTAQGDVNPFWADLDRERIGLAGLSGNGAAALEIAFSDERIDAVVGWDPARSATFEAERSVPVLFLDGDYFILPEENDTDELQGDPTPAEANGRHYDRLVELGYDAMQIVTRAGVHIDSGRPVSCQVACSRYGGAMITYYTLAWFDRYLARPEDEDAVIDALRRLTADVFDGSADSSAIGTGTFDPLAAAEAGDVLAGNQPILLEGMPVVDRLSFNHPSRYQLSWDEHRYSCVDLRGALRDGQGCSPALPQR